MSGDSAALNGRGPERSRVASQNIDLTRDTRLVTPSTSSVLGGETDPGHPADGHDVFVDFALSCFGAEDSLKVLNFRGDQH